MKLVLNASMTKCSFFVAVGGAAKNKTARYVLGSGRKEMDGSWSTRSELVGMERWKGRSPSADRYIGSRVIVAVQVAAVLRGVGPCCDMNSGCERCV